MSATDELRRLLDERGEFYQTSGNRTWWGRPIDAQTGKPINVFHNQAQPMGEDRLLVELQLATPERAVAATLGHGTCTLPETRVDHGSIEYNGVTEWRKCSACGEEVLAYPTHFFPNCGRKVVN